MNKRGQELTVGTLILIVLGVIILVLLVLGYSMGWGNLWQKINIFQGTGNIESVIQACKVAVSSNAPYTYCDDFKKIKIGKEDVWINCEYGEVKTKLDSTLGCEANTEVKRCARLIKDAPLNDSGVDCSKVSEVNSLGCRNKCNTDVNGDNDVISAASNYKSAAADAKADKKQELISAIGKAADKLPA